MIKQLLVTVIACLMIAACGKKGDLYLPEAETEQAVTPEPLAAPADQFMLPFPEQGALPAEEETGLPVPADLHNDGDSPEAAEPE